LEQNKKFLPAVRTRSTEVSAKLLPPDGSTRNLRVGSGAPETAAGCMNRTYRWQGSATIDCVAIGLQRNA
jgi:hypothetical protein